MHLALRDKQYAFHDRQAQYRSGGVKRSDGVQAYHAWILVFGFPVPRPYVTGEANVCNAFFSKYLAGP